MKKKSAIMHGLADKLAEVGIGDGRICISAGRRAVIENHKGVLECTRERVLVLVGRGKISVQGSELAIDAMNSSEMLMSGKIQCLEWE